MPGRRPAKRRLRRFRRRRRQVRMTHRAPRYSRITGTGSYLPPAPGDQRRPGRRLAARRHRDLRRVDRRAHRHPRSPLRRARRHLPATSALERVAPCARGRRLRRRATIDLIIVATSTPDMVFPSAACILQHKLGVAGCAAFDVQAVCSRLRLRAHGRRLDDPDRRRLEGAGDRRRSVLAHPRLQRPHHLRAVRRRRRRRGARGERRRRASWRASCMPTAGTSASCACRAPCRAARCSATRC